MGDAVEGTTDKITPLEQKIIQQVEYYFGDLNLPKDKFLQAEMKKDDGWVTLETMTKFNRLKTLSTDFAFIAGAIRKSKSGMMEVDSEGNKIRRAKPLPENSLEYWQEVKARTVYVKRFPDAVTLDELQEFFKKFGNVERLTMRYYKNDEQRNFKGSVFVTFVSREEAKKFVELESVKYGDDELVHLMQDQYFKEKQEETKKRREERKHSHRNGDQAKKEEPELHYTAGRVLQLKGIPKEGINLDDIRGLFNDQQKPDWIDFEKGDEEAFVRFENQASSAEEVLKRTLEAKGGKLALGETEVTAEVITGDEEKRYWERTQKAIREARDQKSGGRGGRGRGRGRGRGGGGRGGRGRGRGRERNDEGRPKNVKKRFSSSSESDAEGEAERQHRKAAKRPAPEGGDGATEKKAKPGNVKKETQE